MKTKTGEHIGCGVQATLICFRGRTKRAFFCATCAPKYDGSGKVSPYESRSAEDESPKEPGTFYGPVQFCGAETDATVIR